MTAGPQGLKPAFLLVLGGTAEVVPFPFAVTETDSNERGEFPETSLLSVKMQGSFDSAVASLREVPAALR
jgi:hypothetical protein